MESSKLNTIEAIALLAIIMANKIILNLPEQIISSTGSAAWLNAIYIILIAFVFILLVLKLMNNFKEQDILDISELLGGRFLKCLVGLVQIVILFLIANTIIRSFSYTLKTIYFQQSPIIFIIAFMVVPEIVANKCGLKSISKICLYVLPVAYVGLAILLLAPAKDFEVQRIFPVLGYGIDATFLSGLSNLYALSGLGYMFLFPTLLKKPNSLKKITLLSLLLSGIALFFSVLCMLFIFSFHINTNENMTLYLLTMVVHHGNVIHGINILFMMVWILSIIAYISTTVFFIIFIIKKTFVKQNHSKLSPGLPYAIPLLLLPTSVLLQNNPIFYFTMQNFLSACTLGFIFIVAPLILILASIKQSISSKQHTTCIERSRYEKL